MLACGNEIWPDNFFSKFFVEIIFGSQDFFNAFFDTLTYMTHVFSQEVAESPHKNETQTMNQSQQLNLVHCIGGDSTLPLKNVCRCRGHIAA